MSQDKFELKTDSATSQQRLPLPPATTNGTSARPERRKRDSARLVWDSKPKRPPSPRDIEFQAAEVVIPNPARDAGGLPFSNLQSEIPNLKSVISNSREIDRSKMNRLIWGDNLLAMQALLAQGYEGKIDLIYIDPPFDSRADYSHTMHIGDQDVTKEPSVIERLAYRDTWEGGLDSYLDMLYPRLHLMRRLLSEQGTLYVHCDWHVNAPIRIALDEVFGRERFINEIIWKRAFAHGNIGQGTRHFGPLHETIYSYSRSDRYTFNQLFSNYDPEYVTNFYKHVEAGTGRKYQLTSTTGPGGGAKGNPYFEFLGVKRYWRDSKETMTRLHAEGRIIQTSPGSVPRYKRYLDEMEGVPLQDIWVDVSPVASQSDEMLGYRTQKPETLLERIVRASSSEGSLVADFFCGSGTTAAVAEKLGRRWITSDLGKVGIQVTRGRLVQQDAKPFLIENIGNYQREMIYLTGGRIGEMQRIILKLYGATPHPAYRDLGVRAVEADSNSDAPSPQPSPGGRGSKTEEPSPGGRGGNAAELVYVGYPDRPTTAKKVEELARLAESLDGSGYKRLVVLAWDYDYSYDEAWDARMKAAKKPLKVEVQKRLIPPDVYDYLKKAKTEADIEKLADKIVFHEKPYLKLAKPAIGKKEEGKREVTIGIERYVLFDLPVPDKDKEKLSELVKENFAVLIDYWAVDWNYDGATFRSMSQAIRGNGKKAKVVTTELSEKLPAGKKQTIAVRVVDVFGNDAAGTVEVDM